MSASMPAPAQNAVQNFGSSEASAMGWPSFERYVLYGAMPPDQDSADAAITAFGELIETRK